MSEIQKKDIPKETSPSKFRFLLLFLTILGGFASAHLLQVHLEIAVLGSAQSGLCNVNEIINCEGAAKSGFATIGNIPIAGLGLGFYAASFLLLLFSTAKNSENTNGSGLLVSLFGLASAYSLFLLLISIAVVKSLCPWCVLTYLVNFLGLAFVWKLHGSGPMKTIAHQVSHLKETIFSRPVRIFLPVFVVISVIATLFEQKIIADHVSDEPPQEIVTVDEQQLHCEASPTLGPENAPIRIVEFSDFECPYCSRLAATMQEIEEAYSGQVQIMFRQYPLSFHPHADGAARAAVCAHEQGKFWEYHDELFSHQRDLTPENLLRLGSNIGLDTGALEACMESSFARNQVDADQAAGEEIGVTGTPYFFINGTMYAGAYPFEAISELIDELLIEIQ